MKNILFYLNHVIDAINTINDFTKGIDRRAFLSDRLVRDGVVRNIEVIGEAVKNMPEDFKKQHMGIEWKKMAGMRDKMAHFYFGIDYVSVWDTIKNDLPKLKENLLRIIEKMR